MQEFRDGLKVAVISDITLQELELAPEIVKSQLKNYHLLTKSILFLIMRPLSWHKLIFEKV